ncbi:MAG: hypothetical protein E7451_06225 [Ruminococcaceae bacterium]|nr:hypothetical protein [Oscillospiraceae bacterium]
METAASAEAAVQTIEKPQNLDVIANQSSDWCGDLLKRAKNARLSTENVRKSGRLPRQCAHWLAMTRFSTRCRRFSRSGGSDYRKTSKFGCHREPVLRLVWRSPKKSEKCKIIN